MNDEHNELLIIKVNAFFRQKDMIEICEYINEARKTGTIVLPPYCDAIVCPKDIEVKIEDLTGKEIGDGK